jgi:hypothetical protein
MSRLDDPKHPGKHINPETGIWPTSEWGAECQRGFSRNARFGGNRVIAGTNRAVSRKWRTLERGAIPESIPEEPLLEMEQDDSWTGG